MSAATHYPVCVNGRLTEAAQAQIAHDDRAFRFGDGLFETIALVDGVPYQWELHMQRLHQGAVALEIPLDAELIANHARCLLLHTGCRDGFIRIQLSRGQGSMGYRPTTDIRPWHLIELLPARTAPASAARLWRSQWRKVPPECLPSQGKLSQGVNATLALLEAQRMACHEALQLAIDGQVAEAASGNLLWLQDGIVYTPPLSSGCLPGTTRAALLRLAAPHIQERPCHLDQLAQAEAVALCNVGWGIWPVASLLPQGWTWPEAPPIWAALAQQLQHDRIAYAADHAHAWR